VGRTVGGEVNHRPPLNPNTRGFGRGSSTNQVRDIKIDLFFSLYTLYILYLIAELHLGVGSCVL